MRKTKKYNKTNYIKPFSMGLLLLCSVSLISVGFSSWYSGIGSDQSADVNIEIGDVVDKNSFFTFEGDTTTFEYIDTALVINDIADPSYNTAYISIPFQMDASKDNKKIKDYLGTDSNQVSIRTVLVDNTTNHPVFSVGTVTEGKLVYTTTDNTKETDTDFSGSEVITSTTPYTATNQSGIDFTISDFSSYFEESKVYFKVQLKLTFTYTNSFKTDIYDKLDDGKFNFSFKAGVII